MKRLFCVLLACLMLCGCGARETAAETAAAEVPAAVPEATQTQSAPRHITRKLLDNYEVDADVESFGAEYAVTAEMAPLALSAEQLLAMIMPEDTSGRTGETDEFRYIVTTEDGSSLTFTDSNFTAFRGGYTWEDLWELEILLTGWAEEHPEDAVHVLDFMTPEEAVRTALELFEKMNVGYEPVVDVFAALTGPEINAYQQVCLDDPMYTEFGKFHMLPEMGENHDAYYLSFTFSFGGIPLADPSIVSDTYGVSFAPRASMLITRRGISYFSCLGLQSLASVGERKPLIPVEEAMDSMAKFVQTLYAEEDYMTTLVELRYLPLNIGGRIILMPYWGMELLTPVAMENVTPGTHPYPICYWFNGFTGTHYMDE